jgi:methylene-tetrahydromethanopterin dehydrogenase
MMEKAKKAMVPPFEVSVFADPAGSFTTAAAMVACAKTALKKAFDTDFKDKRVIVYGGTGVVAFASAVIASMDGAKAFLVGYDGPERVRRLTMEANDRFGVDLDYADGTTEEQKEELAQGADVIFSAGPAGRQILGLDQFKPAKNLKVVADVNAVPPLGIEGVGIQDNGVPVEGADGAVGIGALAIGDIKYKTEIGMFKEMIAAEEPVYLDFRAAYRLAQELTS